MNIGYSLFYLTVAVSSITVIMVLQTTYLYTKMQGSRMGVYFLLLQGSFILWTVIRLSEAYAPVSENQTGNRMVQFALYYFIPIIPSELLSLMLWYRVSRSDSSVEKLSLKMAIQNIGDCVLILDTKQRIMDANYSFFEPVFSMGKPGTYEDFCCQLIADGILDEDNFQQLEELLSSVEEREIEFHLSKEDLTCISKATALTNKKGDIIGTMISFHDITEYRKLIRELEDKKLELIEVQDKLQDYLLVVDRLETAKEKRAILLKIQNSIGQEIMELLTMLEVVQLKEDSVSVQEIELAVETCRCIIGRIRSSVSEIEKY